MRAASAFAPAKVNLALHVLGRRSDGYHEIISLIAFADVGDTVVIRPAGRLRLRIDGPFEEALTGGCGAHDNLAWRAAELFAARFGGGGVRIALTKRLPVASGLGGGSSDAAAVLRLLAAGAGVPPDDPRLRDLAGTLGADVPACLHAQPCIVRGIGEIVTPLERFPLVPTVLVNPRIPVPTAEIFRRWSERPGVNSTTVPIEPRPIAEADDALDLARALAGTSNMLQPAACATAPAIGIVLSALTASEGCALARMSGSGATCFGLFATARAADSAAKSIAQDRPEWWVASTSLRPCLNDPEPVRTVVDQRASERSRASRDRLG